MSASPSSDRVLTSADWRRAGMAAVLALAVFAVVGLMSGTLDVEGGFGWDGAAYGRMVTDSMTAGTPNTAMRPLIILAVRVPYRLGVDLLTSFRIVNLLSALVLFLIVSLFLARRGQSPLIQVALTVNVALCIATSKMFGFYPALIDLGALAVMTVAVYFAYTGSRVAACLACVAAALSREFAVAVALYGIHRALRLGRPWPETMAVYLPALLVPVVLRIPLFGFAPANGAPLSIPDAARNVAAFLGPSFFAALGYFMLTVFGGLTLFMAVRLPACLRAVWREPEILTMLAPVIALTIAAGGDLWRYLAFALPAFLLLARDCFDDLDERSVRRIVFAILLVTVLTQRPLEGMTTDSYFRDWFPLYRMGLGGAARAEALRAWWPRLVAIALCAGPFAAMVYLKQGRSPLSELPVRS